MEWTNEVITKFIKMIRMHPCLWDPSDPNKKNRGCVNDALVQIGTALNMDEHEVRRKKESLFQTYRHMRRKMAVIERNGTENYKPSWQSYDALHEFLGDIYTPQGPSSMNQTGKTNTTYSSMPESVIDELQNSSSSDSNQFKISGTEENNLKRLKVSSMTSSFSPSNVQSVQTEKVISTWSQLMVTRLKQFDEYTREFLMNQIDNYMFRAKMKQIKRRKVEETNEEMRKKKLKLKMARTSKEPLFVDVATTSKSITESHEEFGVGNSGYLSGNAEESMSQSPIDTKENIICESDEEI